MDFCFEARSWKRVVTDSVELTKVFLFLSPSPPLPEPSMRIHIFQVFRQADERFVRILNEIRHGIVTNESDSAFKATLNNILFHLLPLLSLSFSAYPHSLYLPSIYIPILFDKLIYSLSIESADGHEIVATRLEPFRKEGREERGKKKIKF